MESIWISADDVVYIAGSLGDSPGRVVRSLDGGDTCPNSPNWPVVLHAMWGSNKSDLYVVGTYDHVDTSSIYHSDDEGLTWQPLATAPKTELISSGERAPTTSMW